MCPGSAADWTAYSGSKLQKWVSQLPLSMFVLADTVYMPCNKLLIPFIGSQRDNPENSSFNYFLSQLQVCIEQAFGLVVGKWQIFLHALEFPLPKVSKIIMACCQLHNLCINKKLADGDDLQHWIQPVFLRAQLPKVHRPNKHFADGILDSPCQQQQYLPLGISQVILPQEW
jgi:hypothetical protein